LFKHGDERVVFACVSYLVCGTGNKLKDGKSGSRTSQEAIEVIQGVNRYTGLSHYSGINQSSGGGEWRKVERYEKFRRFLGGEKDGI